MTISHLHDATLLGLDIDWPAGTAILSIGTMTETRRITVREVKSVQISREMPWGPSNSINNARIIEQENDVLLEVAMQSGDMIAVVGRYIDE